MEENKIMDQEEQVERFDDVEVDGTGNEGAGLGLLILAGGIALGAAAVTGGKKLYQKFKDRKHKPEVVDEDVHCVNDDEDITKED